MKRRHKAGKWRNSGCSLNISIIEEAEKELGVYQTRET